LVLDLKVLKLQRVKQRNIAVLTTPMSSDGNSLQENPMNISIMHNRHSRSSKVTDFGTNRLRFSQQRQRWS